MENTKSPAPEAAQEKTNDGQLVARLAAHPFLAGMSEEHLQILSACATATRFEAGQVIFRAGEPANGFYLLERGEVVLQEPQAHGESQTIDLVAAGEPLGWSWLFPPYLWQLDARASEPCRALCLSGILLRQHRDEDFFLSHELFKRTCEVMVRRLQAARARLGGAQSAARPAKKQTSFA